MVVGDDDGGGVGMERRDEYVTWRKPGRVERAARDLAVSGNAVPGVQEDDEQAFADLAADDRSGDLCGG